MKRFFAFIITLSMSFFSRADGQATDRLLGEFINSDVGLSVSVHKTNDYYHGFFQYQKQRYPFKGVKRIGILDAEYEYNGAKIPFTLSYLFGAYYVTSEGVNIPMERKAENSSTVAEKPKDPSKPPATTEAQGKMSPLTGKTLADKYGGYSFRIPAGWSAKEENGSFTLSRSGEAVLFSISPHNYRNKQDILNNIHDIVDQSTNTHIRTTATNYRSNDVFVRMEGSVSGQPVIMQHIFILSPYSGGASFAAAVESGSFPTQYTDVLKAIASSVQFTKPAMSGIARQWLDKLTGRQLIFLQTSGGGSQRITINLYRDGTFSYANNSSYLSGGSSTLSYAGKSSDKGTWKVQSRNNEPILLLFADDRSIREYVVSQRSTAGEINLNGRRYFMKTLQ